MLIEFSTNIYLILFISPSDLTIVLDCDDESNGATDSFGDGCEYYMDYPHTCGLFDDEDFDANAMCCACLGNFRYDTMHQYI